MDSHPAITVLLRIGSAVVGGYLLVAAAASAGAVALHEWLHWPRSEAVLLMTMIAFVGYMLVMLWAFAARSLGRTIAIMAVCLLVLHGFVRMFAP